MTTSCSPQVSETETLSLSSENQHIIKVMKEFILGYDIRFHHKAGDEGHISKEERDEVLLNPEVEWPLSVDTFVWPSIFMYEDEGDVYQYQNEESIYLKTRNIQQERFYLWQDFDEMTKSINYIDILERNVGIPIAISVHLSEEQIKGYAFNETFWSRIKTSSLFGKTLSGRWKLIGYDVADDVLRSGLSALHFGGFNQEEKPEIVKEWAHFLNEHGLFIELDGAMRFAEFMDKLEPGHAPFYAFGLYGINEKN